MANFQSRLAIPSSAREKRLATGADGSITVAPCNGVAPKNGGAPTARQKANSEFRMANSKPSREGRRSKVEGRNALTVNR